MRFAPLQAPGEPTAPRPTRATKRDPAPLQFRVSRDAEATASTAQGRCTPATSPAWSVTST